MITVGNKKHGAKGICVGRPSPLGPPRSHALTSACVAYPASAFEPFVHAPKGGLLTPSCVGIEAQRFTVFRDRGLWYTAALSDWILHKGVLRTQIICAGQPIVIL